MNTNRILGIVLFVAAIAINFLVEDMSGGIGFLAGATAAIGIGMALGWIFNKKKAK